MRLLLSLPVLLAVLFLALEGPAPAQAAPDGSVAGTLERVPDKLKELGSTLEDKARAAIDHIKNSDISTKTRNWFSDLFKKVKDTFKDTFS